MTFSFNINLADEVSQVRQWLGDTDSTNVELQDETIQAILTSGLSVIKTAARCARNLAAKYARLVDSENDRQSQKASQAFKQYTSLAQDLDSQALQQMAPAGAGAGTAGIDVGGTVRGPDDRPYFASDGLWPGCW